MVTYICDKCGERIYKAQGITTMTLEMKDGADIVVEEHHFCPECTKEFFKWEEDEGR